MGLIVKGVVDLLRQMVCILLCWFTCLAIRPLTLARHQQGHWVSIPSHPIWGVQRCMEHVGSPGAACTWWAVGVKLYQACGMDSAGKRLLLGQIITALTFWQFRHLIEGETRCSCHLAGLASCQSGTDAMQVVCCCQCDTCTTQGVSGEDDVIVWIGLDGFHKVRLIAGVEYHHVVEPAEPTMIKARQLLDVWELRQRSNSHVGEWDLLLPSNILSSNPENRTFHAVQIVCIDVGNEISNETRIPRETGSLDRDNDSLHIVIRRHIATMISNSPVFQLLHTLLEPFGFPNQQESAHPFKRLDGRPGGVSKGLHFALTWRKGLATWIGKVSWPVLQLFDGALGSRGVEPYVSGKGVIIRRLTLHRGQVHPISQLKALQPRLDERKALRIVKDFGNLLEPLWYFPIRIDIRGNLQELRIITTQLTTTFEAFFVWGPHKWSQESGQANLPYWRHAVHNSQNTLLQKSWASAREAKSPICRRCFSSMSFFLTPLTSSAKEQKQILRPLKMSISASLKRVKGFHDTTSIPHHLVLWCGSTLTLPHTTPQVQRSMTHYPTCQSSEQDNSPQPWNRTMSQGTKSS